jgi:aspartyl/asparaginyl-tRNA synthetase
VKDVKANVGKRVTMCGWAHEFRRQGDKLVFISLRDGTGFPAIIQCVLEG